MSRPAHDFTQKASLSVRILRIARTTSPKLAVGSWLGASSGARIRLLDLELPGRGGLTRATRALIRLLLTRRERAGPSTIDELKANLCSRSRPRFCVDFRTVVHSLGRLSRRNLIFVHIRSRRRVTAAVRSFVWPHGPLC